MKEDTQKSTIANSNPTLRNASEQTSISDKKSESEIDKQDVEMLEKVLI